MDLFHFLRVSDESIDPSECKVHLASWNGREHPLDVYLAGQFDDWQSWQNNKNFGRRFVVALIDLRQRDSWLFVGTYEVMGVERREQWKEEEAQYRYTLARREQTKQFEGRLIVKLKRPGRNSYLTGEIVTGRAEVSELRAERLQIQEFPGFASSMLSKQHLDIVVREGIESWRSALSSVAGVYVIADVHAGKLYIGSATGTGGIWSRWVSYSLTGHGGNQELRELLTAQGVDHVRHFQFGVLEIADTHASQVAVLTREGYWKSLLMTRAPFGYNRN